MNDEAGIIELIEKDILSFESVSRFPDPGLTDSLQKVIGRDIPNPGIRMIEDEDGMTINCEIIVYVGVNSPQLGYDIQTRVKKDIEETTGIEVKAVNIKVEGIDKTGEIN